MCKSRDVHSVDLFYKVLGSQTLRDPSSTVYLIPRDLVSYRGKQIRPLLIAKPDMASEQQNGHHANGSTESAAAAATAPDDEHAQLWSSEADPHDSLPRRALHALLSPFSATALAGLPRVKRPERYLRADAIPHTETNDVGERPTVRDYHSINLPPNVRIPKKLATSVKVEGKIWFANERSESGLGRIFFPFWLKETKIGCRG